MSWPTAALLAVIVVLDGARRVNAGDVILRRPLFGAWTATDANALRRRWTLVSWLPPFWTTLLASPPVAQPAIDVAARLNAVRPWYRALSVLGTAALVALVVGIPLSEARFTGAGVLLAIGVVLLLAVATTLVGVWARRRLGLRRSPAWTALSPFAAPYAAERLLEQALAPYSTVAVARSLLPPLHFREWIRPRAYDALADANADAELREVLDAAELAAVLAPPRALDGAPLFCPRCGAVYREAEICADCATVPLRRFAVP